MGLDIRTIYMMNAVVYLMLHGIIWVSLARYKNRVVTLWSVWGMVSAAGVVLLGSEGLVPDWVVAVFGQVLMAAGNFGRQYAMRSIAGNPSVRWLWRQGLSNLAYLALNGTLFFSGADRAQMMVVFFAFYAINCIDYFFAGRAIARRRGSPGARSVQWSGLVFSGTLSVKCLSVGLGWGAQDLYDPSWDQVVLFTGQFLAISLVNFGFMQIQIDQFQQERVKTELALAVQRDRAVLAERNSLDLTQLLREREEIVRRLTLSNKSAGMGALVSGIAHEINQPLTTMVLKTELIETYLRDGQPETVEVRGLCEQIRKDTHRAAGMIKTLRNMFASPGARTERLDFAGLLRDVVGMVRSHADRQGIAVTLKVPQQLWFWGDATKLQQVVLNLLNNAIQAFATKDLLQPSIVLNCQLVDGWVELQVQDNGCGIDVAAQDDVFALFKSPRSHGMGVGLWLSQSVVQDHGGTIEFTSTPGQGTVFVLRLPVRDSDAQIS